MGLAEAQKWMSEQLGDTCYDGSVKDYARSSFIVPRAYLFYIDEEGLCKERESKPATQSGYEVEREPQNATVPERGAQIVPASDRNLRIFDLCLAEAGLKLEEIDQLGVYNWHNTLVSILSVGICRLMSQDELKSVLAVKMPNYSKEHDCQRLVSDFYKDYTKMNAPMSQRLRAIYAESVTGQKDKPLTTDDVLGDELQRCPDACPSRSRL